MVSKENAAQQFLNLGARLSSFESKELHCETSLSMWREHLSLDIIVYFQCPFV